MTSCADCRCHPCNGCGFEVLGRSWDHTAPTSGSERASSRAAVHRRRGRPCRCASRGRLRFWWSLVSAPSLSPCNCGLAHCRSCEELQVRVLRVAFCHSCLLLPFFSQAPLEIGAFGGTAGVVTVPSTRVAEVWAICQTIDLAAHIVSRCLGSGCVLGHAAGAIPFRVIGYACP